MRFWLSTVMLLTGLAGCGLYPSWRWERPGASEDDYRQDEIECKSRAYSGIDGAVTQERVRRMQSCMLAKGWRKGSR